MKKVFIILTLVIAFNGILKADEKPSKGNTTVEIKGKVVDQQTGEALVGVKVFIPTLNKSVYTNFDGEFKILVQKTKVSNIEISMVSYKEKVIDIKNSASSKNLELKLERMK